MHPLDRLRRKVAYVRKPFFNNLPLGALVHQQVAAGHILVGKRLKLSTQIASPQPPYGF